MCIFFGMGELKPISIGDYRELIESAKQAGSGMIILDTPSSRDYSGSILHFEAATDPAPAMLRLLDAISSMNHSDNALANRKFEAPEMDMLYRSLATRAALDEIRDAFAARLDQSMITVRFDSIASFDPISFLIIRRIIDHSQGLAMSFVFPCVLSQDADPESDERDIPRLYHLLELCVKIKMWNRATLAMKELNRVWSRIGSNGLRGLVAFRSGMVEVRQGNMEEVSSHYENALRHLEAAGDNETLVKALNNLGNIRLQEGKITEARRAFSRAVTLGEELQSDYHLAVTYGNYAHLMHAEHQLEEAIENLRKSFVFTSRSGFYGHAHYAYLLLGECLGALGQEEDAAAAFAKSVRICELEENLQDEAQARCQFGKFLLLLGRIDTADIHLSVAEKHFRLLKHKPGMMASIEARAKIAGMQGDKAAARERLDEALSLAQLLNNRDALARMNRFQEGTPPQ